MKRDHRGKLNRPAPSAPSDESKERDSGTSGLLATSRRDFLKYAVGSAALLGPAVSSLTASAQAGKDPSSTRASKKGGNGGGPKTEKRTYLFDLSYMDTSAHEVIMVAGGVREPLESISSKQLAKLRHKHPILELVPDAHLTHIVTLKMPADAIQLCYVQRIAHAAMDGSWDMSLQFYHLPTSALQAAREREATMLPDGEEAPVSVKWARYGLSPFERTALADPVGEDMLKDTTDQATALIAGHPEIACGDPTSAAYIQCSIIGTQSSTMVLGDSLTGQGPATPTGGWATQTPLINPDTGQQAVNSLGQLQYLPVWSSETNQFAGQAIQPSLTSVKGDTTLGVNVTNVDPTQTATLGTTTSSTGTGSGPGGAIWTLHDGMSTVDQSPGAGPLAGSGFSYTFNDQSPGHGYSITVSDVTADSVTFTAKNWFVRYLGLYVRYLDSDGNPIPVDTVVGELGQGVVEQYFPLYNCCSTWNTANDLLLDLAGPEFEILGIPVSTTTVEHTIPIPTSASSVLILASGLGSGSNDFADTTIPGKVMTGVFNLALPTFFLYFQAAGGVATLDADLEDSSILITDLPLALELFADMFAAVAYDDPASFATLGVSIAEKLLSQGAAPLITLVATALAGGETESAVLDALPIVGNVLAAIFALGTAAAIAETSAEVAQSPNTYVGELVLTHDIDVTIQPDDPAGFPATATSYTLTAQFDGGTPHTLTLPLPTVPAVPQVATFQGVPLGGQVTVSVGFYTTDNWLAGQGSIGPLANVTDLAPEITITENLVPLTSATVYSHKELIVLDDQGNHIWLAQTTPPSEVQTSGCDPVNGQLCALSGITVSTTNADVGQAWQAYNGAVNDCSTNAPAQLQQFSNISSTETPQSEYLFSGCGFEGPVRVAYDLLGRDGFNFYLDPTQGNGIIRQIRLSGSTASFDGPFSNQAWGKLSFPSDAFLLHPVGQIISVNTELSKIEVLKLPAAAVADSEASPTQAYGGVGVREGLMTAPTHAALSPKGAVLILETGNNRIQAFDLNANPAPLFDGGAYFVPLTDTPVTYLDLAVEYSGYMYVLSLDGQPGDLEFRLDIYTPGGAFLSRTTGVNAARLAVNYWRDIFTQNYQVLTLADGSLPARTEPSISHWIPSTP